MQKTSSSLIARNFLSVFAGQVLSLALNFFAIALAARFLGVEDYGNFNYLLAVITIISQLIDLGLIPIVFRETSVNKNNYGLLNTAFIIRFICYIIVVFVFNIVVILLGFGRQEILLSNILFVNVIVSSKFINIRGLMEIPFKVDLRMHVPMVLAVIDNFIFLVLVLLMPVLHGGLLYLVVIYMVSNLPGFALMLYYLKKEFNFSIKFKFVDSYWLLKESLPLYGFVLLNILYQQIDIIFIQNFDHSRSTGIYSAAVRLSGPLLVIPTALIHTIFPSLMQNIREDKSKNIPIINFVFKILYFIAFTCAILMTFKSGQVVTLVFGKAYQDAALPNILLFWSQIFLFYSFFVVNLLVAYNKQFWNFIYALLMLIVNSGLNYILIPKYSFLGTSEAKILTAFAGFIFTFIIITKIDNKIYMKDIKILTWSILVAVIVYLCSFLPFVVYFILSALLILIATFLIKYFNSNEINYLLNIVKKPEWADKLKFLRNYN